MPPAEAEPAEAVDAVVQQAARAPREAFGLGAAGGDGFAQGGGAAAGVFGPRAADGPEEVRVAAAALGERARVGAVRAGDAVIVEQLGGRGVACLDGVEGQVEEAARAGEFREPRQPREGMRREREPALLVGGGDRFPGAEVARDEALDPQTDDVSRAARYFQRRDEREAAQVLEHLSK